MSARVIRNASPSSLTPLGLTPVQASASLTGSGDQLEASPNSHPAIDVAALARDCAERVEAASREAFEHGRVVGRQAADEESKASAASRMDAFVRLAEEQAGLKPRLRAEAEADLVTLAIAIARRILRRELTVDPEAIGALAQAALERLSSQEAATLVVGPNDEAAMRRALERIGPAWPVNVEVDVAAPPATVRLRTARGTLDASVSTQLAEIERGLADLLPEPA